MTALEHLPVPFAITSEHGEVVVWCHITILAKDLHTVQSLNLNASNATSNTVCCKQPTAAPQTWDATETCSCNSKVVPLFHWPMTLLEGV